MDYRIISIGTLSKHPLWDRPQQPRTAHATTTLIRTESKTILVDPALPEQVLTARLAERAGITLGEVTDVFLTCFRPAHRMGLPALGEANWWISEAEREAVGVSLIGQLEQVGAADGELEEMLKQEIALMQRCKAAPDKLDNQVDLFPLNGFTPGTCGLLLSLAGATVLIAGDAVATAEHLERGMVLEGAFDIEQAKASLVEAIEIADWIICGHDNLIPNLTRRPF